MTSSTASARPHRPRPRTCANLIVFVVLTACAVSDPAASSEASSSGSPSTSATSEPEGTSSGSSSSSGSDSTSSSSAHTTGSSDTTGEPFEDPTAFDTDVAIECNTLDQDCTEGERCTPYANDEGDAWNAVRCVPLEGFESTLGDPCEIEGNIRSGFDNCGPATLCLDVDPTATATVFECVAMCVGTPDDFDTPTCADSELSCTIEGTLAVCLPSGTAK